MYNNVEIGYDKTLNAYKTAVEDKYRFFSFGDSMIITWVWGKNYV